MPSKRAKLLGGGSAVAVSKEKDPQIEKDIVESVKRKEKQLENKSKIQTSSEPKEEPKTSLPLPVISTNSSTTTITAAAVAATALSTITLPRAYSVMLERWTALEATLTYRRRPIPFKELKSAVENYCGHRFEMSHVGQMLSLWPGCYTVRKVSLADDQNLAANQMGIQPASVVYIEIGSSNDSIESSLSNSQNSSEGRLPSNGGLISEAAVLHRQKHIEKVICDHFTTHESELTDSYGEEMSVASVDIEKLIRESTSSLAVSPTKQAPEKLKHGIKVGSDEKKIDAHPHAGDRQTDTLQSRAEALRNRIMARQKFEVEADEASGGAQGRRRKRLLCLLPSFCDCLHSYLLQRRVNIVPKQELLTQVARRFPAMIPQHEVNELMSMVLELDTKWYREFIAPPTVERIKEMEMFQFNGTIKYSLIRGLAVKHSRSSD